MRRGSRHRFDKAGALALAPQAWGGYFDVVVADEEPEAFELVSECAVVDVCGPLVSKAEGFWAMLFDSYAAIRERAAAAFESSAKAVVLRIDSPGGDVAGCFELARDLRAMSAASGKAFVAFVDGMAASAGYALACSADEVIVTPTAMVGSIGVINALCDVVEMNRAIGLNVAVITSGARKADGHPDVAITEEAVEAMRAHVNELAAVFFSLVEDMRGVSSSEIQALDGGIFYGARATSVGLADRVSTWTDTLAALSAGGTENRMKPKGSKYDEAIGALQRAAEGDDEDSKKAKKALKAIDDGDEPGDDDKDKDKDADAKAKAEEDEKKKDAEAKALATANLALAKEVQTLKAKEAERASAEAAERTARARADLFAKRPDITGKVKAALEKLPLEDLAPALEDFPRVSVSQSAAANAMTANGGNPEPKRGSTYEPRLTAQEQEIFAKLDGGPVGPRAAVRQGTAVQMPIAMSQDDITKRLAELDAQEKEFRR